MVRSSTTGTVMNLKLSFAAAVLAMTAGAAWAQSSDTLRFGIEAAYPPFESKTASGQLEGFDVDVGNAVCASCTAASRRPATRSA